MGRRAEESLAISKSSSTQLRGYMSKSSKFNFTIGIPNKYEATGCGCPLERTFQFPTSTSKQYEQSLNVGIHIPEYFYPVPQEKKYSSNERENSGTSGSTYLICAIE